MNTIQSEWASFAEQCIPGDAPAIQIQETKRAFYAGSMALMGIFSATEGQADEVAQLMIDTLIAELKQFEIAIANGKA